MNRRDLPVVVRRLALNWDVTETYYDGDPADDKKNQRRH